MSAPQAVRGLRDPALTGRDGIVDALVAGALTQPGLVAVVGPDGAGRDRLVEEAAAALAEHGARVVGVPAGPAPALIRVGRGLDDAGLPSNPVRAGRLRPVALLAGEIGTADARALRIALAGSGTVALAVLAADPGTGVVAQAGVLGPDDARALVAAAAPGLDPDAARRVLDLGAGLAGRLVCLARAAHRWPGGDAPFPVPPDLAARALAPLGALAPGAREVARWLTVAPPRITAARLSRLSGMGAAWVEDRLDEIAAAGLIAPDPAPGPLAWRVADPLALAALAAGEGRSARRRRHQAALHAGRALGDGAEDLVRHAVGAADPDAVLVLGTRAAAAARAAGDPAAALAHAGRALSWAPADAPGRAAAAAERGFALVGLGAWAEGAEALERAGRRLAAAGDGRGALACAEEAAAARWRLGEHEAAFATLAAAADAPGVGAARAEALATAAHMSAMMSRHGRATVLAAEARRHATSAGAHEAATRALVVWGHSRSGAGALSEALEAFGTARREAAGAGGRRNATFAAIHESHALLGAGQPAAAARIAREGIARAAEAGVEEHRLVLLGNLGEALAALGDLEGARERLEQAAAGWEAIGLPSPTPADPPLAWLLVAEGRLEAAVEHSHALAGAATLDRTLFEQLAGIATGHALASAALGQRREARAVAGAALGMWSATDDRLLAPPLLTAGVMAGDDRTARACADALARLAAGGGTLAAAFLPLAHARLSGGGAAASREAADRLQALGMAWWAAWALLQAGLDRDAGAAGEDDLMHARAAFEAMGAGGWRQRAEAALRGRGRRVPSRGASSAPAPGTALSAREVEVLSGIAMGLTNREVGERLFISERTVARHVARVFARLGVSTRTAAVHVARERGLITDGDLSGAGAGRVAGIAPGHAALGAPPT